MKCLRSDCIKIATAVTFFAISSPLIVNAAGILDQSCNGATTSSQMIGGGGHIIYQSFKPRYGYLTAISVLLKTDGVGEAKLTVLTKTDHKVLANKTMAEQSGDSREYLFDFDPVQVTPGQEYLLIVEPTKIENEGISWYYVQNEKGDCYADGTITASWEDPKVDMRFTTYGYNEKTEGSVPTTPQGSLESSVGNNNASTSNINVRPPTKPDAEDRSVNPVEVNSSPGEDNSFVPQVTTDALYPPEVKGEENKKKAKNNKSYIYGLVLPIAIFGYVFIRRFRKK